MTPYPQEMAEIFPERLMFLGGDEVDTSCWDANPRISEWLQNHRMTSKQLQDYFWQRVSDEVSRAFPRCAMLCCAVLCCAEAEL